MLTLHLGEHSPNARRFSGSLSPGRRCRQSPPPSPASVLIGHRRNLGAACVAARSRDTNFSEPHPCQDARGWRRPASHPLLPPAASLDLTPPSSSIPRTGVFPRAPLPGLSTLNRPPPPDAPPPVPMCPPAYGPSVGAEFNSPMDIKPTALRRLAAPRPLFPSQLLTAAGRPCQTVLETLIHPPSLRPSSQTTVRECKSLLRHMRPSVSTWSLSCRPLRPSEHGCRTWCESFSVQIELLSN